VKKGGGVSEWHERDWTQRSQADDFGCSLAPEMLWGQKKGFAKKRNTDHGSVDARKLLDKRADRDRLTGDGELQQILFNTSCEKMGKGRMQRLRTATELVGGKGTVVAKS